MMEIKHITLLVKDYDEALSFYTGVLGFQLIEDTPLGEGKRWVLVSPSEKGCQLLLARAEGEQQLAAIGQQSGGRVFLFLHTTDFDSCFKRLTDHQVRIVREPVDMPYGTVCVFEDLYGNLWDLIGKKEL